MIGTVKIGPEEGTKFSFDTVDQAQLWNPAGKT
jgi:hypothetical protein